MCCGIFFSYRSLLKRHDEITELSIWLYLFHLKIHRQFFYVNWKQNHKYTKKLVIFFNNHQTYSLTPLSQWKVGLHIFHCAQDCVQPVYQNAKLFAITWVSTATPSLRSIFSLGSANHTCCMVVVSDGQAVMRTGLASWQGRPTAMMVQGRGWP